MIVVQFESESEVKGLSITFQGGFGAKLIEVYAANNKIAILRPEDCNHPQDFAISPVRTSTLTLMLR